MATKTPTRESFERVVDELQDFGRQASDRLTELFKDETVKERMHEVGKAIEELRLAVLRQVRCGAATTPFEEMTVEELHDLATEREIPGRSTMNKAELIDALRKG